MRKYAFSLVEVVISLGLFAVLLTSLTLWHRTLTQQKSEIEHLKAPLLEKRYLSQRLQAILPQAEAPFFSHDPTALVFLFNRGPWKDPKLSGKVLGKLFYHPQERTLSLTIWPSPFQEEGPREEPTQTFILLDRVDYVAFSFFHPPDPFKKPVSPEEIGQTKPQEGWQELWLLPYHQLPSLVKLTYQREGEELTELLFDLHAKVIYPSEKGVVS